MVLPGAKPLAFHTAVPGFLSGKPQPLILFPDFTLETAGGDYSSPFVEVC